MTQPIPTAALTDHIVILGKTGSGKSNAAKTVVEALLEQGERVCVLDPTGTWWGLRLKPSGKPSRFKPVIFGGQHADVPIGAEHGEAIAEVVGRSSTPAIIDTRLMTVRARTQFFTGFGEALLRSNQGPLHLVIDEAHLFAPQGKVNDPASGQMLHAANNLVSLGRGIGLRVIMISQRPAKLHNDSLSQCETLVAMRLIIPHDREAVGHWIKEAADLFTGREIMATLPSLPTGDAWVWSPQLGPPHREHFPLAATYDSGRAPDQSEAPELQPIDLRDVTGRLAEVGKDVLANDPRALRAEIAKLKEQLARAPAAAEPDPALIERARLDGYNRGAQEVAEARDLHDASLRKLKHLVETELAALAETPQKPVQAPPPNAAVQRRASPAPAPVPQPAPPATANGDGASLSAPQQRVLDAIVWWESFGIHRPTVTQVAFVAGYTPNAGTFNNYRGALKSAGLVAYPGPGLMELTGAGLQLANRPRANPTTPEVHARVRERLTAPQVKLLDIALQAYPDPVSVEALAAGAGYTAGAGTFNNYRGSLRTLGLIEYPGPGKVVAADWLFPF